MYNCEFLYIAYYSYSQKTSPPKSSKNLCLQGMNIHFCIEFFVDICYNISWIFTKY